MKFIGRISYSSYFCVPVPYKEKDIFLGVLVLESLIGLHRTIQFQLLQHYWPGRRLGLLWYWMVCLANEQRFEEWTEIGSWSNRQIWPWSTEWSRAKANRNLPREPLMIANTLFQQHKRRLYTWITKWWSVAEIMADCGSDHELLIAKFRLKLKKVGTTTRPFMYDLDQITYNYTSGSEK